MFGNLEQTKRNPANTEVAEKRKSLTEQSEPKGVLGNAWARQVFFGKLRVMRSLICELV